jgi:hypothetical protein
MTKEQLIAEIQECDIELEADHFPSGWTPDLMDIQRKRDRLQDDLDAHRYEEAATEALADQRPRPPELIELIDWLQTKLKEEKCSH